MITIRDLHKRYGRTEVLCGISLAVQRGEVCVLLGPSGGGKSTLLRAVNGLESFDQGEIQVDDLVLKPASSLQRDSPLLRQLRRRVGMVFQQFNLFPHRNVLENIIDAPMHVLGKPRREAIEQAKNLLARVGLSEKADAMPSQLSGGQQQRVAIARSLAMEPEAILFDEPTSALDPRMTAEVINVITDLAQSGQTMVVVTHAIGFARSVAHTIHVMHAGRIAESGPPQQIFENPQQDVTREFLAETT